MYHLKDNVQDQLILICAPTGKDGVLAAEALQHAGLNCRVYQSISELLNDFNMVDIGALFIAEEILSYGEILPLLSKAIGNQPAWSDLPIVLLSKAGGGAPWVKDVYEKLGNLTLLERPVRPTTLISAARSALRARFRQHEIRIADQRKDEFLAMLAHELRNPLAPIGAAAELLMRVHNDSKRVKQASEIITRQVKHMGRLIDDLMDVARVTRGIVVLEKEPIDVRHILSEAVEQVNPFLERRHHRLMLDLSCSSAFVMGDAKRLVQVIANLLNNAAKYTSDGGTITVSLHMSPQEVLLAVRDNGIGMTPDLVKHAFDLFTQAERTSDRSQGGLGLGLALVKSLVESHKGTVKAESSGLNQGSTFTVSLPRLKNNFPLTQISEKVHKNRFSVSLRILVVDDNSDAADMLKMILELNGHEVIAEYSAYKAIKTAPEFKPQICILDIGLPDIDGYTLARRLKNIRELYDTMFVAVTGYGQEEDQKNSKAAGFDHHFVKPVDLSTLLNVLSDKSSHHHVNH